MSGRWFRFYDGALDDPKVQQLPGELFKAWVNILCAASRREGLLPDRAGLAFMLRKSEKATDEIVAKLAAAGLIDITEEGPTPHNWKGRQYVGDTSYERVKRHRAKRSDAGLLSQWQPTPGVRESIYARDGNACVYCASTENLTIDHKVPELRGGTNETDNLQTACRQCNASKRDLTHDEFVKRNAEEPLQKRPQNRTEQITEQNRADKIPRQVRKTKLPDNWKATEELLAYAAEQGCADPADTAERFRLHHQSKGTLGIDWNKGFQFWCRNQKTFTRANGTRPTGYPQPLQTTTTNHDDPQQWRARLRGYNPTAFWNQGDWGPRPGEAGCRVPKPILDEWRGAQT